VSENGWTTNKVILKWLKHFEKFTCTKTIGIYYFLVLDNYKNHYSVEFEKYYCTNNILTFYIFVHSFYLLQPLDIGCFALLKKAYSQQIENLVQSRITYISKKAFISIFVKAFKAIITKANIQRGFRSTGLIPYDPEVVISQLDIKLFIPTSENSRPTSFYFWVSKIL